MNVTKFVRDCRERCDNAIRNTATGKWLSQALEIIERQYDEIQDARTDQIAERQIAHEESGEMCEEIERLRKMIDRMKPHMVTTADRCVHRLGDPSGWECRCCKAWGYAVLDLNHAPDCPLYEEDDR